MFDFSVNIIQHALVRKFAILAAILLFSALPALAADIYVDRQLHAGASHQLSPTASP